MQRLCFIDKINPWKVCRCEYFINLFMRIVMQRLCFIDKNPLSFWVTPTWRNASESGSGQACRLVRVLMQEFNTCQYTCAVLFITVFTWWRQGLNNDPTARCWQPLPAVIYTSPPCFSVRHSSSATWFEWYWEQRFGPSLNIVESSKRSAQKEMGRRLHAKKGVYHPNYSAKLKDLGVPWNRFYICEMWSLPEQRYHIQQFQRSLCLNKEQIHTNRFRFFRCSPSRFERILPTVYR
jgi:hypothetical protein